MDSRALKYLKKMKEIQKMMANFLHDEKDNVSNLLNYDYFEGLNDEEKKYRLIEIFNLIIYISDNYLHTTNFYEKIESIINIFAQDIKQFFSNNDIYRIFIQNKRIFLFLLKEKIAKLDQTIISNIQFDYYFIPEVKTYYENNSSGVNYETKYKHFNENRLKGENESPICEIIRKDSVEEFKSYVKEMNVSLNEVINPSIFETNKYLIDNNNLTLVNYAAFNGSSKIFHYLMSENVEFSKDDILYYAIHGNNQEIIKYLEDNFVKLSEIKDRYFIEESIMYHRNDIVRINKNFKPENRNITTAIISGYNYELIEIDYFAKFPELFVRYNYSESLYYLLNSQKVDVNQIFVRPNGENTLLSIACKNDCVEIANLLSKRPEIDPNIRLYQLKDVETTFDNIDIQYTNQFDYITLLVLVFVFLPYVLTSNIYMKIMALIMLISYLCILVKFKILTRICRFVKAAFHGYNVTKLLLSCLLNFDDTSALSLAIVNYQSEIVKILLENPKICVNIKDWDDAAENCFIEIIPAILSKLNSEDRIYPSNENSLLSTALKFKNEEVTQLLLKMNGVDKLD